MVEWVEHWILSFFFFFSFVTWKLQSPRWRWQCIAGPSGFRTACGPRECGLARFPFWVARRWGRTAVGVLLSDCQYRKGTALYGQCGVWNTGTLSLKATWLILGYCTPGGGRVETCLISQVKICTDLLVFKHASRIYTHKEHPKLMLKIYPYQHLVGYGNTNIPCTYHPLKPRIMLKSAINDIISWTWEFQLLKPQEGEDKEECFLLSECSE